MSILSYNVGRKVIAGVLLVCGATIPLHFFSEQLHRSERTLDIWQQVSLLGDATFHLARERGLSENSSAHKTNSAAKQKLQQQYSNVDGSLAAILATTDSPINYLSLGSADSIRNGRDNLGDLRQQLVASETSRFEQYSLFNNTILDGIQELISQQRIAGSNSRYVQQYIHLEYLKEHLGQLRGLVYGELLNTHSNTTHAGKISRSMSDIEDDLASLKNQNYPPHYLSRFTREMHSIGVYDVSQRLIKGENIDSIQLSPALWFKQVTQLISNIHHDAYQLTDQIESRLQKEMVSAKNEMYFVLTALGAILFAICLLFFQFRKRFNKHPEPPLSS